MDIKGVFSSILSIEVNRCHTDMKQIKAKTETREKI